MHGQFITSLVKITSLIIGLQPLFVRPQSVVICNSTTAYINPTSDGLTRMAIRKDGDFIIHFLVELSSSQKCDKVTRLALHTLLTAQYAIDRINNDRTLLPTVTLGYQIDDGCVSLPVTMARALEIVSLHRPSSQCRVEYLHCTASNGTAQELRPAIAVVGTRRSFLTIPVASLMNLFKITEISPSATSRLLEKRDLYSSFFRTISSDTAQVKVMIEVLKHFRWRYIFAIGSDDDYGKMGVAELKVMALSENICIVQDEYVPFNSVYTQLRVVDIVSKMRRLPKATVVVLFGYAIGQGNLILQEAERQNIQRLWLTSEAWNPEALDMRVSDELLKGVLTVSTVVSKSPDLFNYALQYVTSKFKCDPWLRKYLRDEYGCEVARAENGFLLGTSCVGTPSTACKTCKLNVTDFIYSEYLMNGDPTEQNLVDAVYSIAHGLQTVINSTCGVKLKNCEPSKIVSPSMLTDAMYNVSFTNINGIRIAFDKYGNPANSKYTIETIQTSPSGLRYIVVGSWDGVQGLSVWTERIVWPDWTNKRIPVSVCSEDCPPGTYVEGKTGCCWECTPCAEGFVSNSTMSSSCTSCPLGHHSLDKVDCVPTPTIYLKASDAFGISLIILSAIGWLSTGTVFVIVAKLQSHSKTKCDRHHLVLALLAPTMGFSYVILHVIRPTDTTCILQSSWFFLVIMFYSSIFLVRTMFVNGVLSSFPISYLPGRLAAAQIIFILLLLLLESIALVVWFSGDPIQASIYEPYYKHEKWIECKLSYTVPRLAATILPCITLLAATFQSIRERKGNITSMHSKFLSFGCIALCIVMAVYLPTSRYVVGIYRAIVSAFTLDICSFTFLSCTLIPRVYACLTSACRPPTETAERKYSAERHATDTTDAAGQSGDLQEATMPDENSVWSENRNIASTTSSLDGKRIRRHRRIDARQYTF